MTKQEKLIIWYTQRLEKVKAAYAGDWRKLESELTSVTNELFGKIEQLKNKNDNLTVELEVAQRDIDNLTRTLEEANDEIKALEAENAELRAKLDKAVELKANVGDVIYMPWKYDGNVSIATLEIIGIDFRKGEFAYMTNLESDSAHYLIKYKCGIFRNKDFGNIIFTDYQSAEKRLAELKKGGDDV